MLRWIVISIALLVFVGVGLFFFAPQFYYVLLTKFYLRKPVLAVHPLHKDIVYSGQPYGDSFTLDNVTFSVPWTQPAKNVTKNTLVSGQYADKKSFVFFLDDKKTSDAMGKIAAQWGDASLQQASGYDFYQSVLETTSDDFGLIMSPRVATTVFAKLVLKGMVVISSDGDIYRFDNGTIKGYQIPTTSGKMLMFEIFNNSGGHYTLLVGGDQSEADDILSSIKTNL